MPYPRFIMADVVGTCRRLLVPLAMAFHKLGSSPVILFLELVPERGDALWKRFAAWKREDLAARKDAPFWMFVDATIKIAFPHIAFPRECYLGVAAKWYIFYENEETYLRRIPKDDAAFAGIYFGEGPAYLRVLQDVCDTCLVRQCPHNGKKR